MRRPSLAESARLLAALGLAWQVACASPVDGTARLIRIDGSSTVYPLAEALAEDFQRATAGTRVTIGVSGTGGGLRRFCRGGLEVAVASRAISGTEAQACEQAGISYLELPLAYDGIVIAVHPDNHWVDSLSVEDLRRLWRHEAEGRVLRWSDLRREYPNREIHLFGAGADSGTFDYFTGVITGAPRDSRGDYTASEDDNTLVQGVASDPDALGYFGYAYFDEHREYLRAVPITTDDDATAVAPTAATIRAGAYRPLSRPVFAYVSVEHLDRPDVAAFVAYTLRHVAELAGDVGYVALDARVQEAVAQRAAARRTGSVYLSATPGLSSTATLAERLGVL